MKVLITGSKGQLGLELARQLGCGPVSHEVIETDIHNLDITKQYAVFDLIDTVKPHIIINCAAYTNVDRCETDEIGAFRVNALGARNLSAGAYRVGAIIIQISTDYVFDGTGSVPKREYDSINPQSCYGKSKALGERLVRETNPRHFIIRTAWLYGEGNNFIRTMLKLAREKGEVRVVDDQTGTPTSTADLAICIKNLMETESYGTYHATCEGACSWYDYAREIFRLKGVNVKVDRITSDQLGRLARRPQYSVLENYMLKLLDINTFRHWKDALEEHMAKG